MRDYNPKRRTALVCAGSGTSGAYHAGVLKALDESGIKVDLVVGSGAGTIAASFAAVCGGASLYGSGGFWDGLRLRNVARLRSVARAAVSLIGLAAAAFFVPVAVALLAGVAMPFLIVGEVIRPGLVGVVLTFVATWGHRLSGPYLATAAAPIFLIALAGTAFFLWVWLRDRRGVLELFESMWDCSPGRARLRDRLWDVVRGPALQAGPPSERELGRRYVALVDENPGEPGFREVILRVTDLDSGRVLPFVLLHEAHRAAFFAERVKGRRGEEELAAIDLRRPGGAELLFDAVASALAPAVVAPVARTVIPRGGTRSGEVRRLVEATLVGGCGLAEAIAAGADQIIVAGGVPEERDAMARRRGPWARLDATLAALERQALEREVSETERINRLIETLGHDAGGGVRAWQDPAGGRSLRVVSLYVVRPQRRLLGPLELNGSLEPSTEVRRTLDDVIEQGRTDTYRLFIEPIVGSSPLPVPQGVATSVVSS